MVPNTVGGMTISVDVLHQLGIIQLPILGGSNNANVWVILRVPFPLFFFAVFGLVSYNDPCKLGNF